MEKIDPHHHKEEYLRWKGENSSSITGLNKYNSDIILQYLDNMEKGINISSWSNKGSRSFARLNSLKTRLVFFSKKFEEIYHLDKITDITEEQIVAFFSDMKNGNIKKTNGQTYRSVDTYAKIFKSFWHWYQKVSKKKGLEISEITEDLDTKQEKPNWVYLTEEQVKKLCDNAKYEYKVLFMFLFDSGIRSPTELVNVKVSDLFSDCKELNIREETSKTFGRRIKLMICPELLKEYIKANNLQKEDYIFKIKSDSVNKYLKRLAKRTFGEGVSDGGAKFSEMTLYDFRHISCCYWLIRYKSESALKYRFGWKRSDKIHYYSELLGMKDTISEDDLLIDVTRTEIEKRLEKSERKNELQQDRINTLEMQMKRILEMVNQMGLNVSRRIEFEYEKTKDDGCRKASRND